MRELGRTSQQVRACLPRPGKASMNSPLACLMGAQLSPRGAFSKLHRSLTIDFIDRSLDYPDVWVFFFGKRRRGRQRMEAM